MSSPGPKQVVENVYPMAAPMEDIDAYGFPPQVFS
jgi:hypothetical protein